MKNYEIILVIINIVLLHKITNVNLDSPIKLAIESAVYITLVLFENTPGAISNVGAMTHEAPRNILNKMIILQ